MSGFIGARNGQDPGWQDPIDTEMLISDTLSGVFLYNNKFSFMNISDRKRYELNDENAWVETDDPAFETDTGYSISDYLFFSDNEVIHCWGKEVGTSSTSSNWRKHFIFENGEWSRVGTGELPNAISTKTYKFIDKDGDLHIFGQFWSSGTSQSPTYVYLKHYEFVNSEQRWYSRSDIPTNYGTSTRYMAVDTEEGFALLYLTGTNRNATAYTIWNKSTNSWGSTVNISSPYIVTPRGAVYYKGFGLIYTSEGKFYKFNRNLNPPIEEIEELATEIGTNTYAFNVNNSKLIVFYQDVEKIFNEGSFEILPKRILRGWLKVPTKQVTDYVQTEDTAFNESEYILTKDQSFDPSKTYYEIVDHEFIETVDPTMNPEKKYYEFVPVYKNYYELVEGQYVLTTDETMDPTKTYYEYHPRKTVYVNKKISNVWLGHGNSRSPERLLNGSYWIEGNSDFNALTGLNILAKAVYNGHLHVITDDGHYILNGRVLEKIEDRPISISDTKTFYSIVHNGCWYIASSLIHGSYKIPNSSPTTTSELLYFKLYRYNGTSWDYDKIALWSSSNRAGTGYTYRVPYDSKMNVKLFIFDDRLYAITNCRYKSYEYTAPQKYTGYERFQVIDLTIANLADFSIGYSKQVRVYNSQTRSYYYKTEHYTLFSGFSPKTPYSYSENFICQDKMVELYYTWAHKNSDGSTTLHPNQKLTYTPHSKSIGIYSLPIVSGSFIFIPYCYTDTVFTVVNAPDGRKTTAKTSEFKTFCKVLKWDNGEWVSDIPDVENALSPINDYGKDPSYLNVIEQSSDHYILYRNKMYEITVNTDPIDFSIEDMGITYNSVYNVYSFHVTGDELVPDLLPIMFDDRIYAFPDVMDESLVGRNPEWQNKGMYFI